MNKVAEIVRGVVYEQEEVMWPLGKGVLNLTAYASQILETVEQRANRPVKKGSIVAALARLAREIGKVNPLVVDVLIKDVSTVAPLLGLAFDVTADTPRMLAEFYRKWKYKSGEFVAVTHGTDELAVICPPGDWEGIERIFGSPKANQGNLAAVSVGFGADYAGIPNVIYSLLRRLATARISTVEIVSTHSKLTVVVKRNDLQKVLGAIGSC